MTDDTPQDAAALAEARARIAALTAANEKIRAALLRSHLYVMIDHCQNLAAAREETLEITRAALAQSSSGSPAPAAPEPQGTFACPICGKDTPHSHGADVVAAYEKARSDPRNYPTRRAGRVDGCAGGCSDEGLYRTLDVRLRPIMRAALEAASQEK